MNSTTLVIDAQHLTKRFGKQNGVSNLELQVIQGETFGFIGPNGAGKTTTIRMVLGQIRPTSGEVKIFGEDAMGQAAHIHRRIGFLSGDMEMDTGLTGEQYLEYITHLRGGQGAQNRMSLAKRLQCDLSKPMGQLSRGNRQKVGLIAAVMHAPDLLILDEPSSGFDPLIQVEFAKIIEEHKARGGTALISSHVLSEVQHLCDRVGLIRQGKMIKVESMARIAKDLFKTVVVQAAHAAVALDELQNLKGVRGFKGDGRQAHFEYGGSSNVLLKALAKHEIEDITIQDADLETMFMHYYEGK